MTWILWISSLLFFSTSATAQLKTTRSPEDFAYRHPWLGDIIKPGITLHEVQKDGDRLLYDAHYEIDDKGLRITPKVNDLPPENFFFGGSLVFGIGVNQQETLPWYYSRKSATNSINAGVPGGSPHQALSMFKEKLFSPHELKGVKRFFYLYFYDHIPRANGYLNHLSWLSTTQYFPRAMEGDYDTRLPFSAAFPWRMKFSKWFGSRLNQFGFNYPLKNQSHELYFCQILKGISAEIKKVNKDARFIVAPWFDQNPNDIPGCVKKGPWKYLVTHEDLPDQSLKKYFIPINGHPNPLGQEMMADILLKKLSSE